VTRLSLPSRRTCWSFLGLAALGACTLTPDESKSGTLGNGSFSYDCINAQDPYCPDASTLDMQPFPSAIAYGGRFNLTYTPTDPTTYPSVTIQPVSSDFFVSQGDVFGALRVGTPWFVAYTQDGKVVDLTSVTVAPIAAVQVADTAAGSADLVGTTHTFGATAQGALGQPLAGEVLYSWSSSDPSVAAIQYPNGQTSPASTMNVFLAHEGRATITAWTSTAQGSVVVDVVGVQ
jgi:hypothetical protein